MPQLYPEPRIFTPVTFYQHLLRALKKGISKLINELGIAFGSLLMFPSALVHSLFLPGR